MSRIIVIAAAIVISIGANVSTFAQARPAATPTPTRPAAPQPTPVRPAVTQPAPVAAPANVPASKIAIVDTSVFGDEKVGITRLVNTYKALQVGYKPTQDELLALKTQIEKLRKKSSNYRQKLMAVEPRLI